MYEITMLLYSIWFQFQQIAPYWVSGLIAGSLVSVFLSDKITEKMTSLVSGKYNLIHVSLASFLGIVSPLCMYGTVPIIAALGLKGVSQHLLVTFMVSSILLNPNIFFLSFALGTNIALIRFVLCFLSGVLAGTLVYLFFRNKKFFNFEHFVPSQNSDTQQCKPKKRFFPNLFKAFRITAPYLLIGLTLTALFDRYVPSNWIAAMFGSKRGLGVLFATTLSIPMYACGGGTIPLIKAWMYAGMGAGDAMAFMLAGPAVKINNLSAVKMILGLKHFFIYLIYSFLFAILCGIIITIILNGSCYLFKEVS